LSISPALSLHLSLSLSRSSLLSLSLFRSPSHSLSLSLSIYLSRARDLHACTQSLYVTRPKPSDRHCILHSAGRSRGNFTVRIRGIMSGERIPLTPNTPPAVFQIPRTPPVQVPPLPPLRVNRLPDEVPLHRHRHRHRSRSPIVHRHQHQIIVVSQPYRPPPSQCDMCGHPIGNVTRPIGYMAPAPGDYRYCLPCEDWWRRVTFGKRCGMCRKLHHVEDCHFEDGYWYCDDCVNYWYLRSRGE
jgi:hypothetical protein